MERPEHAPIVWRQTPRKAAAVRLEPTAPSRARSLRRKLLDVGKVPPPPPDAAAYHQGYFLGGAHAQVVTSADASRFTATRLLALGPLGLAFKKGPRAAAALIIEGVGWSQVIPVDPANLIYAYRQAADLNARASVAHQIVAQARAAQSHPRP